MPKFKYEARNPQGQNVSGFIEADNQLTARRALRKERMLVIDLEEISEQKQTRFAFNDRFPINTKDRVFFCRQLTMMLKSGLTLVNTLTIMSKEFPKQRMRLVLTEVIEDLRNGISFSESLGKN